MLARNDKFKFQPKEINSINVEEYALLSSLAYSNDPPPAPWTVFYRYEPNNLSGYRGVCFAKNLLTPNAEVVFSHRGTVLDFSFTAIENLIADIYIVTEKEPYSVGEGIILMDLVSQNLANFYEANKSPYLYSIKYSSTGHSLGAVISDLCTFFRSWGDPLPSITFENPGSLYGVKNMMLNRSDQEKQKAMQDIKNRYRVYQNGVNIINTCNEQAGKVFRVNEVIYNISDPKITFPPTFSFGSSPFKDYPYLVTNTFCQHLLVHLMYSMKSGFHEIDSPVGFYRGGYADYLDAEKYPNYWNEYFDIVWTRNDIIRSTGKRVQELYRNDQKRYLNECYVSLKNSRDGAKNGLSTSISENIISNNKSALFQPKEDDDMFKSFVMVEKSETIFPDEQNSKKSGCSMM